MSRIAVIGNSGGGKSTLARRLAQRLGLPYHELDALLFEPGWVLRPSDAYEAEHQRLLESESWVMDGLGRFDSLPARLARATRIVLIDMPVWQHFSLAARRHFEVAAGKHAHLPRGQSELPNMDDLFETMWTIDQTWLPKIRAALTAAEAQGKAVTRLTSLAELDRFQAD